MPDRLTHIVISNMDTRTACNRVLRFQCYIMLGGKASSLICPDCLVAVREWRQHAG